MALSSSLLYSAYAIFAALEAAQDLSLLAGEAGEDLSELADFVEEASPQSLRYNAVGAAQLIPHVFQKSFLNKAAAATTRQLELMSAHLQSAASLASLHGRALECAKVLLKTPSYLPFAWLGHSAPSIQDTVDTSVQRDLEDAGGVRPLCGPAI